MIILNVRIVELDVYFLMTIYNYFGLKLYNIIFFSISKRIQAIHLYLYVYLLVNSSNLIV